ncbi:MAG: cytochrome c oxidase assembly factor Coa1 family protein [Thermoguttaceae bacterium]
MENDDAQEVPREGRPLRAGRPSRWPTVLAVLIVLAAVSGIIAYDRLIGRFKRSEPYRTALALVQKDPKAMELLGQPIKDATLLPGGSIHTDGDRGEAILVLKVAGPKTKAAVRAQARRVQGRWELTQVELTLPDGKRVGLETVFAGGSVAPKFQPGKPSGGVEREAAGPGAGAVGKPPEGLKPETPPTPAPTIQLDIPDVK